MRIKLLFVIDNLEFGGGERVFAQIINGLSFKNYEIYLVSHSGGELYQSLTNTKVCFMPLDFSSRVNPSLIFKLIKIIKDKSIDIVHVQGGRAEFYARIATGIARSSKYVSTVAMPIEGYDVGILKKSIYFLLDRATERYVDKFTTVSETLQKTMINQHRVPSDKVIRIYNGIEISNYDHDISDLYRVKIRDGLELKKDDILLGAVGRLVWQKGFEFLIKCIHDVVKEQPEVKVVFVGDGPLRKKMAELSIQLGIEDKIIFTGFRCDIKDILSAIDIMVIPSLLEGFPMVTLEAMAMAKPIIATRIDGISEQITDGIEGILVPPGDTDALAKAIIRVIKDRNLARSLGSAARKKVEKEFTVEKMISETENIYQSLLK